MSKVWFLSLSVIGAIVISLACVDTSMSPGDDQATIRFKIGSATGPPANAWLMTPQPASDGGRAPGKADESARLSSQAAIDEVNILVLHIPSFTDEFEFRAAWEQENGRTALPDSALCWDDSLDFWDNVLICLQTYNGALYRFAGVFSLEVADSVATGTITANPGLNYFFIALREGGQTRYWNEKFEMVVDGENRVCFGCLAPRVRIISPTENSTSTSTVTKITGTVSDDTLTTATLFVNGLVRQTIALNDGAFANDAVLSVGENTVAVQASNTDGPGADVVTVNFQGEPASLRATLTWDTRGTDMDLQMENSSGITCSFENPDAGGMRLDVDDTNGFGPENISVYQQVDGNYRVGVKNSSNKAGLGTIVTVHLFRRESLIAVRRDTITASNSNVVLNLGCMAWPEPSDECQ